MVRLSEIIRKTAEKKSQKKTDLVSKTARTGKGKRIKRKKESIKEIQKVYEDAILQMRHVMNDIKQGKSIKGRKVVNIAKKIVEIIRIRRDLLLSLINKVGLYEKEEDFLYQHSVNVSILAANLGLGLGYNKAELIDLCASSLLHDIGMVRIPKDVITNPKKLTADEYNLVKGHPTYGMRLLDNIKAKKPLIYAPKILNDIKKFTSSLLYDIGIFKITKKMIGRTEEISKEEHDLDEKHTTYGLELLDNIKNLTRSASEVISQHHERIDGTGYPEGKKGDAISENAKIVAIADVYDALTHSRPYRKDRILPSDAVKIIVQEAGSSFDPKLTKVLLNSISCHPIGSFVLLNNNQIGRVIRTHENFPLRPVVEIIIDAEGKPLKKPERLDLAKSPILYIKQAIDELDLKNVQAELKL